MVIVAMKPFKPCKHCIVIAFIFTNYRGVMEISKSKNGSCEVGTIFFSEMPEATKATYHVLHGQLSWVRMVCEAGLKMQKLDAKASLKQSFPQV